MSEEFPIPFGRYELVERLAVGGMAELFLARMSDGSSDATYVIKRLLPQMAGDAQFNAMFVDEAKLTARLSHPKIARTYALGRHGAQLFIVMEYVDGIDVLALLRECAHRRVRLPAEVAVYIAREILDALHFAHTQVDDDGRPLGVVHRDVSPSNVLLGRDGNIVLVDFGIARATVHHHRTRSGSLKGKYGYMSPEQVVDGEVDARSDVFSAAIVLTEMLTGRRLFAAPNELDVLLMVRDADLDRLDRFGAGLAPELSAICRRALRKNPLERYASAAELRDELTLWLAQNGHELGPPHIARIVDSLYDDAWRRRRQSLSSHALAAAAEAPAPGVDGEVDGIPLGTERSVESVPVVAIELDESVRVEDILHDVSTDDIQTLDPAVPAAMEEDLATHRWERPDELELAAGAALGDAVRERAPMSPARRPRRAPGPAARSPLPAGASLASALAADPRSHDPATRDFDDSEVSGRAGPGRRWARRHADSEDVTRDLGTDGAGFLRIAEADGAAQAADALVASSAASAAGGDPALDADPDDRGSFADVSPLRVMFRLAVARATGLLLTRVGGIRKEIYFRDGVPEYVTSNVAGERLGEYLTKRGVLSPGELSMALAMMPHYRDKMGDTLVGLGLMKPLDVFRELTSQVRDKLIDVCTWARGEFSWYAGVENTRDAFPLDLDSFEVLGAGARALPASVVDEWLGAVERLRPRVAAAGRVSPDVFQLGGFMRELYGRVDGERTTRALCQRYTDDHERGLALRVLYLLVQTELIALDPG